MSDKPAFLADCDIRVKIEIDTFTGSVYFILAFLNLGKSYTM